MAVLPILTVPHPLLTQKARPVRPEEFGDALHTRLTDMAETMYAAPGVGLAGPQVGDLRRILVADITDEEDEDGKRERARNLVHVVNPVILERSKDKITWEEGCLSVPEFWEDFTRPRRVRIRYYDAHGQEHDEWFEGYPAVILQHEMDHLDGVVILDKVSRLKRGRYLKKAKKMKQEEAAEAAV
ncbi:MAG: peptide deformylase [Alphaproteobacteria bacterium]|nr:peptide deformylase [Alphaproteobacteria bacterium]MCB9794513.1 peptide deformylase [Alphaproteobacteria bacterium]